MRKRIANAVFSIKFDLLLSVVMLVAFAVRFWGIGFGMPHDGVRPDEAHIVEIALSFGSGDFNPRDFVYPTFPFYLLFGFYVLYFVFGWFIGRDIYPTDFALRYHLDPTHFFIISRSISAILGVFTVYLTYRLALLLFNKNKRIAILSAFFLSIAYIHVRDSHFGTVDVQLTFWIVGTMIYIARIFLGERTLRNYLLAGILAGVATGTKYVSQHLVYPLTFAHFFTFSTRLEAILRWARKSTCAKGSSSSSNLGSCSRARASPRS